MKIVCSFRYCAYCLLDNDVQVHFIMNRNTHKNVTVRLRIQQHHQGILSYLESTTYKNSQISGITTHEIEIQVLTCVSKLVVEGRIVVQCEKRVATLSQSKAL